MQESTSHSGLYNIYLELFLVVHLEVRSVYHGIKQIIEWCIVEDLYFDFMSWHQVEIVV